MRALIDTSSLLSMVRYYLPFDKKGVLFEVIKRKFETREIILLDAVFEECKYVGQKAILKKLDYLEDKDFLKENRIIVKTEDLIPLAPAKFLNQLKKQFVANPFQFRKLTEGEFEVKKKEFLDSADAKLIMYAQRLLKENPEEEFYLVTEETPAANDLKLFKKIPAICDILGIPVITLPELLEKYPEVDLGFG
ncbi:DUF4411 family protein [Algoriphagus boritolerans]|uniref:DUF4411 family protein n=1 Tax=Algoriphagus boritolerans DSM 17298 = JCM 18970 TaxID=1120964 RepID=A0A1H5TWZ4_9BACT|nr:DUF4411 family protein [Algoriphagus boritolerans]SEF67354.1 protein of unknown function [Algoriphagus boritolerans DSM 17298 = JCM 18970]